jgi:hypothetical protein
VRRRNPCLTRADQKAYNLRQPAAHVGRQQGRRCGMWATLGLQVAEEEPPPAASTACASGIGVKNSGRPLRTARIPLQFGYCPAWFLITSSTWALTASRLKLAGACIGGKSMAVFASSATFCCTETKRQNSRA